MSLPLPPPKQSKRKRRRSPKKQSKYEFTNNDNPFREPPTNSSKDQKVSHIFNQNINSNINKNPNTFDDLFTSFQSNPSSIPPKPEVKIDDAVIQDGPGWNDEIESVSVEQNEIENENDATTDTTTTETLDRQYIIKKIEKIDAKILKHQEKLKMLQEKKSSYLKQLDPNYKAPDPRRDSMGNKKEYETLNAIEFMKKGTAMLKYGRFGYPKFRQFELSQDGTHLQWYSNAKTMDKSRIALKEVFMLQKGQLTANFKKYLQPRLSSCSFSLIYGNNSKTLDVITKNKSDYTIWTTGLQAIIDYYENEKQSHYNHDLPQMFHKKDQEGNKDFPQDVMVQVVKRDEESIAKRLALQPPPPKKTVQKELEFALQRFNKLTIICNDIKYSNIQELDAVKKRLVDLEQEVAKIRNSFETKKLNVASHEIWRTSVELKALESKIQSIVKSYK